MAVSVNQVMTRKIVTIPVGATAEAARLLMQEKKIRHLPVVDMLDDVVGVISTKDLANLDFSQRSVSEFMTSPVFYIDEETPLRTAAFMMMEKKISCLLVADKDEAAVGIVTTNDLLWYLTYLLRKEPTSQNFVKHLLNLQTLGEVARELGGMGI